MFENRARIVCETLEGRRLLAVPGLNFDGQRLVIVGDDADDFVEIATSGGRLLVNGADVGPAAGLRDVVIDTGGGDDEVFIHDVQIVNRLDITTGEGDDNVVLGVLGGGADVVVGNQVRIDTGEGTEVVRLTEVDTRLVDVDTGADDDVLFLEFVSAQIQLKAAMGDGGDVVIASDLAVLKQLSFEGASGFDFLRLASSSSGKLRTQDFELEIIV